MTQKTPILLVLVAAAVLIGSVIFILSRDGSDESPDDLTITAGGGVEEGGLNDLDADPAGLDEDDSDPNDGEGHRAATVKIESFGTGAPRGAYRGRVITGSGVPVADAAIFVFAFESGMFVQEARFTGLRSSTNGRGEFIVKEVPVGHPYKIKCRAKNRAVSDAACPPVKAGEIVALADIILHDGITLSGTVTDVEGLPVAGARVTAIDRGDLDAGFGADNGALETVSDEQGNYAVAHLGPYQYDVSAEADGYVPAVRSLLLGFLGGQDKEARLDLKLVKGIHSVAGRVQTRKGKPVPRAEVTVSILSQAQAGRYKKQTLTDGKGRFLFEGLPESRCMVTAASRDHFLKSPAVIVPDGTEVVIELDARGAIAGRVIADKNPAGGGSVAVKSFVPRWSQSLPETPGEVAVGREGRFLFKNVLPGKYVLLAKVDRFAWSMSDEIEVGIGKTTQNVTIELTRGGSIKGRLRDSKGRAAEGFEIRLMHKDHQPGLLFGLRARALAEQDKVARSDAKGFFALRDVIPGEYSLEIIGAGMAGKLLRQIHVEKAKTFDTGTITVTAGARLIGTAYERNGQPARGARVVAMSQENGVCKTAVTDNNGFFRMNALAAGSYIVYLENSSWSDLGTRSDLVIQVREAQTEKVEIRMRSSDSGDE